MAQSGAFSRRLSEFKEKFGRLLGARAQGYDELSTLDQPLVGDQRDEYDRRDHHSRSDYQPPRIHGEAQEPVFHPSALPTQEDEMRELSVLAKDAAEILWEMVAMGESGSAVADMRSKAEQLQAQLRGLINDFQGGDEALYAQAFESFDMLSRCLEELKNPSKPETTPPAEVPTLAPPPATAAAAASVPPPAPQEDLISF